MWSDCSESHMGGRGAGETIGRDRHAHGTARLQRDAERSRQHRNAGSPSRGFRRCWDAIIANGTGNRGDGLRLCLARVPLQRVEALPATLAQARLTAQIVVLIPSQGTHRLGICWARLA